VNNGLILDKGNQQPAVLKVFMGVQYHRGWIKRGAGAR